MTIDNEPCSRHFLLIWVLVKLLISSSKQDNISPFSFVNTYIFVYFYILYNYYWIKTQEKIVCLFASFIYV